MGTVCGAGASADPATAAAIEQALRAATADLRGARAALGCLFVSPKHDLEAALEKARAFAPETDFLACTTAGEISAAGLGHGTVSTLLVAWDRAEHVASPLFDLRQGEPDAIAAQLCQDFESQARKSKALGLSHSTTLLFGDGLSPKLEKVVAAVRRATSPFQQIVGGGAGDDGALRKTSVASTARAAEGGVVCAHVFSHSPWGVGVEHGLATAGSRMLVTRSDGNVVSELDQRPALDVYRERAVSKGLSPEAAQTPEFLIQNELGLYFFEDIARIRAPIAITPEGSLAFAGEVPEGSAVCFVHGDPDTMIAAARSAARSAAAALGESRAAGVLVVSCICRGALIGRRYDEELRAIADELPGAPMAGFLSYGEIARIKGKLDGYHNNTLVVVAIPE